MKNILSKQTILLFMLGVSIGIVVEMQLPYTYQGKTIQEWASTANMYKSFEVVAEKQASACELDPSSVDCNMFNKYTNPKDCNQAIITVTDVAWHFKHCPSPMPTIKY